MDKQIKPTDSEKKSYGNEEEIKRTGFKTEDTESKKPEAGNKPIPEPEKKDGDATVERHTPDATPGTD